MYQYTVYYFNKIKSGNNDFCVLGMTVPHCNWHFFQSDEVKRGTKVPHYTLVILL